MYLERYSVQHLINYCVHLITSMDQLNNKINVKTTEVMLNLSQTEAFILLVIL